MGFFVRFWGVRGSIPTPGPRTRRYGGNTSCYEMRSDTTVLIFDAGTGLRELGLSLVRSPPPAGLELHLFLSHPHWDHIQGFPFFTPAYLPTTTIHVYGSEKNENYQLLSGQMANAYFPVAFKDLSARIVPRSFTGDVVQAGDFVVRRFDQRHPGGSSGFRVEREGRVVVFATDCELDQLLLDPAAARDRPDARRTLPASVLAPMRDADLLIADAQYTDEEYPKRVGWGHARANTVVDLALQAGVRQLALTHHDPMHSDRDVDAMVLTAVERVRAAGAELEVFGAREGVTLRLDRP
ncbi:MAG: MBL fold metallo-hydrolase [Myxococcaceae bacterium]|jgi:phosphoribosyl 1,2-cyclic phosphodiesterase|nr:MBL fold metallo-hydrolase [Myxococcaceae bacterium]